VVGRVVGGTVFTVVAGLGAGRPAVVVVPRRDVVGVGDVVAVPGTVVPGAAVDVGALLEVPESAAMGMARPLGTSWGRPAMATPRPAQTTSSPAVPARFAAGPCKSTASA
jgi:hypothetical protein